MKSVLAGFAIAILLAGAAQAATVVNLTAEAAVVAVTEGADRSDVTVEPEQTLEFCPAGCFVTLPNGDRHALEGTETIELRDGGVSIQ